jgi:hypothetical protein
VSGTNCLPWLLFKHLLDVSVAGVYVPAVLLSLLYPVWLVFTLVVGILDYILKYLVDEFSQILGFLCPLKVRPRSVYAVAVCEREAQHRYPSQCCVESRRDTTCWCRWKWHSDFWAACRQVWLQPNSSMSWHASKGVILRCYLYDTLVS